MGKITFILGGARSGKSSYAVELARNIRGGVVYLATGITCDEEMRTRVEKHKEERPELWHTIEEPLNPEVALGNLDTITRVPTKCVIFDCLSFWVSNLILQINARVQNFEPLHEEEILTKVSQFIGVAKKNKPKIIIISNEVGMGIVPDTPVGRIFRDVLGRANQLVKVSADEVLFMVAGVPIKIK